MNSTNPAVWDTYGYVRLSHEDGDKEESNSVTGQKDLIRDYLSCHPELRECGMKVDDGFTGSNFQRPAFQSMIDDIKAGKCNCVVVKDLSRFGRDHLEAGEYIERIFPFLGVRFIAINDHYDSLHRNPESDELIIPFKNLINEAYCRDASIKIRSQLEIKRKRGDFIGSFAVYGYQKDPEDHHRLVVDDCAASVIRDMFRWKLEGISAADIADKLNEAGILTPLDYKMHQGMRYNTPFRTKADSVWSANMVLRILQNPIYIGTLAQGRVTTPSYKVKRLVRKPREEWAVLENHHEAIVDPADFEVVQRVLAMDTRTSVSGKAVELFSGMVFCGECGASMVRKTVPSGKNKYVYYVCSAHKNEKLCYSHSLRDKALEEIVLDLVKQHIRDVIDLDDLMELTGAAQLQKATMKKLRERLEQKQAEIDRCQTLLRSLYESLADGLIDRNEYQEYKRTYTRRREEAEAQAEDIQAEMARETDADAEGRSWVQQFRKHQNITSLDRTIAVTLIDRILIYREHRVEITFRWQNEYRWALELLAQAEHLLPGTEAM